MQRSCSQYEGASKAAQSSGEMSSQPVAMSLGIFSMSSLSLMLIIVFNAKSTSAGVPAEDREAGNWQGIADWWLA